MEESGSVRFSEFAQEHKDIFTKVDAACISDNYWLTTRKPCLTYGLRDINYFTITIAQKPLRDMGLCPSIAVYIEGRSTSQ